MLLRIGQLNTMTEAEYMKDFMFELDICKCKGEYCPIKETCLRYTSKEDYLQAYFCEIPYKDGKCEQYLNPLNVKTVFIQDKYLKIKE